MLRWLYEIWYRFFENMFFIDGISNYIIFDKRSLNNSSIQNDLPRSLFVGVKWWLLNNLWILPTQPFDLFLVITIISKFASTLSSILLWKTEFKISQRGRNGLLKEDVWTETNPNVYEEFAVKHFNWFFLWTFRLSLTSAFQQYYNTTFYKSPFVLWLVALVSSVFLPKITRNYCVVTVIGYWFWEIV